LDFTGSYLLYDADGTKPATDDGESVGKETEKLKAEAKVYQDQFKEDIKGHMEALLEEFRSCGKRMTACQILTVAWPEKSKATLKATEAIVERQELCERLGVWHYRWVKKQTQESSGSLQKSSANRRRKI
jgi:hypothetical protein